MLETLSIQNPKEEKNMVETISREEAAWLAAIIEGEGSLMLLKHQLKNGPTFRSVITVCNTDARIIKAISEVWYKLGCKFYYQLKNTKSGFALSISAYGRKSTDEILKLILPYLKSKNEQAELLIEFNSKMRQGMYQRNGVEWYKQLQIEYRDKLTSMRVKTVNPQRLQRTASIPLKIDDGIV